VRDDDDGVRLFELERQLFDAPGGDRVERARRLVHQQHLRLGSQRAGDAQSLLLSAGETERALFELVLRLVPDGGAFERSFHDLVKLRAAAHAVQPGGVGDVVVNAHRERVRLLEHHADAAAKLRDVDLVAINVVAVEEHRAVNFAARHKIVHAVERFDICGFAAARGADERRDLVGKNVRIDAVERLKCAVAKVELFGLQNGFHNFYRSFPALRAVSEARRLSASVSTSSTAAMPKAISNLPCSLA